MRLGGFRKKVALGFGLRMRKFTLRQGGAYIFFKRRGLSAVLGGALSYLIGEIRVKFGSLPPERWWVADNSF